MLYTLRLPKFEGPLDLLLSLIEEKKLNISEISLAHVADQYLSYIKSEDFARALETEDARLDEPSARQARLAHIADFLVIAARLLLIKSRSLLPSLELTNEEEQDIKELEARLTHYRIIKQAAKKMAAAMEMAQPFHAREFLVGFQEFLPPENISGILLRDAISSLLSTLKENSRIPEETIAVIISFEETLEAIKTRVMREACTFRDISNPAEKGDMIVAFLAILELAKQKFIIVEQETIFEDIKIRKVEYNLES